ncbi:MAG: DMT family transporter, partial [Negativicutes bacterium]|nr:DMT family transporter [Negativicutes bacterium]
VLADPPFWTARSLLLMATLGILHTALALVLYFNGLKSVKVQHASVLSYIDPVSALVYAYAIYAEVPAFFTALGGFLILTASCLVIRRPNVAVSA